ncbi:Hpt domain-containing protein [Pseudovibrio sp. Tun.PSC04-5.I4]|uniref:Hpt domain-containing protein n=1 Tax=Pseudovibrio sp. Tun.PSC04-5.I4 TaxID=1798213 RepID=UPI000B83950F|nr:Hpt domain-containing protein [Pseudovibrio sp. Tun.PSC04-5.I4]
MTFDDPELQEEILELFNQQVEDFDSTLSDVVTSEVLRGVLHRFKGSARGVGAFALGDALEAGEAQAAVGAVPAMEPIRNQIGLVKLDLQQLKAASTFLAKIAPL